MVDADDWVTPDAGHDDWVTPSAHAAKDDWITPASALPAAKQDEGNYRPSQAVHDQITPELQAKTALEDRMTPRVREATPAPAQAPTPTPSANPQQGWAEKAGQELADRASAVWQGMKGAYQATVEPSDPKQALLTPMAQKWADDHGVGGDARALKAILGAFNAAWVGGSETANQIGEAMGMPTLGRDAAAMVESAGMTGAPHVPGMLHAEEPPREAPTAAPPAPEPARPAAPMPEQRALAELEPQVVPSATPEAPAPTPEAGLAARIKEAPAEGLKPIYNEAGEWIGYEREPPAPPSPVAQEAAAASAPNAPEKKAAPVEAPQATIGEETSRKADVAAGQRPTAIETLDDWLDVPQDREPAQSEIEPVENRQIEQPRGKKQETPYEPLPQPPMRLNEWLRRPTVQSAGTIHETTIPGGVKDPGGDLKAIIGGSKGRPGLINNKTGRSLDDAAMAAWEAGYLPGADRPDTNALLDAMREDHAGSPVYSAQDLDRAQAHQEALARNDEIDRLSAEHGIPTQGISREQFFDQLTDRMSVEDQARLIAEQDAAERDAYAEAEKQAKQWAAENPREAGLASEEWNAQHFYGQSQARTLKDLKNEYEQEAAAAKAQQYAGGGERPNEARAAPPAGEEGGGPRPGAPGDQRGAAEEGPTTDILGRPLVQPRERAQAAPTIRNDTRQIGLLGTEPSAVQAQAARDAQGRGALMADVPQKPLDEGLFAPDTSGQGSIFENPQVPAEPSLIDLAKAVMQDRRGGPRQSALALQVKRPQFDVLRDKTGIPKVIAQIKAAFAPTSLRGAKPMEYAIRRHNAESAQAYDQSFDALDKVRAAVDRLSKDAQIDFTDRMEQGLPQPTPELNAVANALRGQIDQWAAKVQGLGRGYLANAIENYMGHIWGNYADWAANQAATKTQTAMQTGAIAGNVRRQPLRGSGSFLKQRSFPTQLEGINAGLVPVTFNPVDLQMIKLHEMQKFYHGTVLADQIKDQGLARWVPAGAEDERDAQLAGWQKLDDTIFKPRIIGPSNQAGFGRLEPGNYWAPEPLARVFNNFMSQGWAGDHGIYDGFRAANNGLNTLQLGFSGFHAAFVTADTAISKVALGIQQIAKGRVVRGSTNILSGAAIAPAVYSTVSKGNQLRKAWLDPAGASPEMQGIVDALKAGGGRISMPEYFRSDTASGAFFRSLSDLRNPQSVLHQSAQMFRDAEGPWAKVVTTPLRIAGRVLDTIQQPLMGVLVPRAKLGVFSDMAQNWLRDNPTATPEQIAAQMTKFQDSVDNRLGQLNYDNLFWNKVGKDIAFITTRSVGWNLGTAREIGGSFVDSGSAVRDIANGKMPQLTSRMAYTIALPIVTAEIGAMLTYLSTGAPPQNLLDYFYPPTGSPTDQGQVERRSIPGYMRDVVAFWHDPLQTALNKTSPLLETIQELAKNRDYYGGIIYDPERDRGPAQAYGDYMLNQTLPFSFRSYNRLSGENAPFLDQAMGFWGFQPAPKSITAPGRGEAFKEREAKKAYKARVKEPGRMNILNAP